MPSDLTIFAAKYLVFIDAVLATGVALWLAAKRPRPAAVQWVIAAGIMLALSFAFSRIGAALHTDPRPFTQDHVRPLISHGADNGFPSDHALLAAAIVAALLMLAPLWSIPFVALGALVDWARVGAGLHHVQDIAGSILFVALATMIALAVTPVIVDRLPERVRTLGGRFPTGAEPTPPGAS